MATKFDTAIQNLRSAKVSNMNLWDAVRSKSPNFMTQTAKATADMFTEVGYEQLKNNDYKLLNDYFGLSLRVLLQQVNISHVKDLLDGVFETYEMPLGAVIQRLAVYELKPVNPAFSNLADGGSVDPFVIRKGKQSERFWHNPIDFQNMFTLQDFQMKQIFISQFGMSEFVAGLLEQLQNSFREFKTLNKFNAINQAINSTDFPLQDTQKVVSEIADISNATDEELKGFILAINDIISAMTITTRTSAFNAAKFSSIQDTGRLRLLVRRGIKNQIKVKTLAGTFNPEELNIPVDIVEVPDFGGLIPYKEADFQTQLYPAYDKTTGVMLGYAETENATEATVNTDDVYYKDPNADVIAVLCDKGAIFETITNPVRSDSIYNPRGLYMNYFLSCPQMYTSIDTLYNFVVIRSKAE